MWGGRLRVFQGTTELPNPYPLSLNPKPKAFNAEPLEPVTLNSAFLGVLQATRNRAHHFDRPFPYNPCMITQELLAEWVKPYLEGQGDLVNRLTVGIIRVTIWVIGVINLLIKSP